MKEDGGRLEEKGRWQIIIQIDTQNLEEWGEVTSELDCSMKGTHPLKKTAQNFIFSNYNFLSKFNWIFWSFNTFSKIKEMLSSPCFLGYHSESEPQILVFDTLEISQCKNKGT